MPCERFLTIAGFLPIAVLMLGGLFCVGCAHAATPSAAELLQSGPHSNYAPSPVEQNATAALGATTTADATTRVIVIAYPIAIQSDLDGSIASSRLTNATDKLRGVSPREARSASPAVNTYEFRTEQIDLAKSPTVRIETDDGHVGVTCSDELAP